ncbi:LysR family transcriptional regulator [Actinomadura sp. WMMA1423]|uniref:LysR family transcriptional regulator n=1 Tax=Actinomadura sp. WMMA1423 TaxID=2591108 RepID=UPI001146CF6B|nr:LysR substrate-binding domain-containing protein [Actinomadura sp. WMMA1423]
MLERHEIEAFLVLSQELHFGRTARRLGVSTARVSQTIRGLERRVGTRLFDRTSRRVEPTPAGRRLAGELGPAWERIGAAMERAVQEGRGVTGTLTAAFTDAAAGQLLAGAARLLRSREPGCRVVLREARPGQIASWLRDGEAEVCLAVLPLDCPGVAAGPVLVREARMLAVPSGHPFARRASVPRADLARVNVLSADPGATTAELLTLVGAGEGVVCVGAHTRRYHARPDVAYVPIDDGEPLEWGLAWRAGAETARVRAFTRAALDLLAAGGS